MTVPALDADLDARYGRTPRRRRNGLRLMWTLGAAIVVVFTAWVIWAGLLVPGTTIETQTTGYRVDDASNSVEVSWRLTIDPGTESRCAVQALNERYGVIGWKVVDVPASEQRTRTFTETVRVIEPANTGLIYRCWLT